MTVCQSVVCRSGSQPETHNMKTLSSFLLVSFIASTFAQRPGGGLPPEAALHLARRGSVLTYDVDVSKCDVQLPDTMPAYSYGDVMNDVYIEYADDRRWRLYSTEERPVNTSRFKIENGGWRVTELELSPGGSPGEGTAVITLTDIEQGAEGKVLASGTLTCNSSSGGITVNAQRVGGGELERMEEAMTAFKKGEALTFTADLSACSKNSDERPLRPGPRAPLGDDASEVWTGRVTGYRVPGKVQGAVEFTSVLMGPKQREVFNVRLQPPDQVLVKSYALSRPTHEPTAVVTYQCVLGTSGTFHIFRV